MKRCGLVQQLLRASTEECSDAVTKSTTCLERTAHREDMDAHGKEAATSRRAGIPREIQWLIEFLIEHALDTVRVACLSGVCQWYTCLHMTIPVRYSKGPLFQTYAILT